MNVRRIHGGGNRIKPGSTSFVLEDGNRIATGWMHGRLHSIDSKSFFSFRRCLSNVRQNSSKFRSWKQFTRETNPANLSTRRVSSTPANIDSINEKKIFVERISRWFFPLDIFYFAKDQKEGWIRLLFEIEEMRMFRSRLSCLGYSVKNCIKCCCSRKTFQTINRILIAFALIDCTIHAFRYACATCLCAWLQ